MSISEEFAHLQEMHENGTLTEAEFSEAKAKVLAGESPASQKDIQRLQIQNEILRLDQDWSEERDDHMFHGRYGSRSVPTVSSSINSTAFVCTISLFFIVIGAFVTKSWGMATYGVLGCIAGLWGGWYTYSKAIAYNVAYERYQQERNKLTDQLEALHG